MLTGHRMSRRGRRLAGLMMASLVLALAGAPRPAHADPDDPQVRLMTETLVAQNVTKGDGVTVAVLSTGVDPRVRLRSGALRPGTDFVGLPHPKPIQGTLIASFLGGDRRLPGLPGMVPAVDILPVRIVPDGREHGTDDWWIGVKPCDALTRGIRYAADHGAGVILVGAVCWGYDPQRKEMEAALETARSKNIVVVAPNEPVGDGNSPPLPAAVPGVIGVGTLAKDGTRWPKYSIKSSVTLVSAPGARTPTAGPDGRPWEYWGPATATAWVAVTAALIRSEFPRLSPAQVAQAIAGSAHHPKGGYNADVGFGVVNPVEALLAAKKIGERPVSATATGIGVADGAHFGRRPGTIGAARHDPALLAGLGALILVSAGALVAAAIRVRAARRGAEDGPRHPWTAAP